MNIDIFDLTINDLNQAPRSEYVLPLSDANETRSNVKDGVARCAYILFVTRISICECHQLKFLNVYALFEENGSGMKHAHSMRQVWVNMTFKTYSFTIRTYISNIKYSKKILSICLLLTENEHTYLF